MTRRIEGLLLGLAAAKRGAAPDCLPIVEPFPGSAPLPTDSITGAGAPDSEVSP
ncbi:hypothetical protein [Streptomyces sp. NPDC001843]|uniref:hypothetical protein n=1 Tax=Streptomyces sp. NPDC001843 TaxID=3364617 RepID=UPI00367ACAA6